MSKPLLLIVLLASVALHDPPRVRDWLDADAHRLRWMLKSALDVERFVPGLTRTTARPF